jgi:hypothetical protein
VYGQQETFKLWSAQSKKYPELTLEQRMTMLALDECSGIVTTNGTVYIDTFEGKSREMWFDVQASTLHSLAEMGLIRCVPDGWAACR